MMRLGGIAAAFLFTFIAPLGAGTINFFQPVDASGRLGYLALSNPGASAASVTIAAKDDNGSNAPGGNITLSLNGGASIYLSSNDIEDGSENINGSLGNGSGYWHLDISSTEVITAQNFLYTPDGSLNELTTPLSPESDDTYLVKFFTEPGASVFDTVLRLRNLTSTNGSVTVTAKTAACSAITGSAPVSMQCLAARSRMPDTARMVCRNVSTLRS